MVRSAALASVVIGAVAGCIPGDGRSVAVVGDSIVSLDAQDLQRDLGDRFDLDVSGNFGKTVTDVLPVAGALADRRPDQVVIELGTNDVLQGVPTRTSMAALRQMVSLFPSARCIHLTDVSTHMLEPDGRPANPALARAFNTALDELVGSDPRLSVVHWDAAVGRSIADGATGAGVLTKDSIHPTAQGDVVLNSLYREALAGCSG